MTVSPRPSSTGSSGPSGTLPPGVASRGASAAAAPSCACGRALVLQADRERLAGANALEHLDVAQCQRAASSRSCSSRAGGGCSGPRGRARGLSPKRIASRSRELVVPGPAGRQRPRPRAPRSGTSGMPCAPHVDGEEELGELALAERQVVVDRLAVVACREQILQAPRRPALKRSRGIATTALTIRAAGSSRTVSEMRRDSSAPSSRHRPRGAASSARAWNSSSRGNDSKIGDGRLVVVRALDQILGLRRSLRSLRRRSGVRAACSMYASEVKRPTMRIRPTT